MLHTSVRLREWMHRFVRVAALLVMLWLLSLVALRFLDPPFTVVHIQRRSENSFSDKQRRAYDPIPLARISPELQHAVIAAEDSRFYQHSGIDWKQVEMVAEEALETGEAARGASTITQQLVKNLYFTTHRNPVRKVLEGAMAPIADLLLGKERVLELYLNVVEWGPGVYGAQAAARHHFAVSAARLTREQAARLAAILPSPLRRKPARMDRYSSIILNRMRQMGW